MSPTVTRSELNNAPDIIAETRLVPVRGRKTVGYGPAKFQCQGKQSFETKLLADAAAGRVGGRNAYRCQNCRKWHVGNRNKG